MKYEIEIPEKAIELIAKVKHIPNEEALNFILAYLECISKNLPQVIIAMQSIPNFDTKKMSDELAKDTVFKALEKQRR